MVRLRGRERQEPLHGRSLPGRLGEVEAPVVCVDRAQGVGLAVREASVEGVDLVLEAAVRVNLARWLQKVFARVEDVQDLGQAERPR